MGQQYTPDLTYDAGPTGCGELIMNLFLTMKKMNSGEIIDICLRACRSRCDDRRQCRNTESRHGTSRS